MTTTFVNNDSDRLVFPARIYENSSSSCTMNSNDDENNNNDSQCAVETTNDCMLLYQSFHWKRVLSWFLLGNLLGASLEFLSFQAILHNSLEQQQEEETTTSKSHLIWFHTVVSMDIIVLYFVMASYFMLLAYQVKNYHDNACQQRISPKTCHFVTSLSVGMVNGICIGMALSMGQDHAMGWRFNMGFMGQTMMTYYCAFLLACHVQRHLSCSSSSSSEQQQQAVVVREGKNNHHAPDEFLERLL